MGWNGSDNKVGAAVPAVRPRKNNAGGVRKGLLVGLIVIGLVGVAVLLFVGTDPVDKLPSSTKSKDEKSSQIATSKPAVLNRTVERKSNVAPREKTDAEKRAEKVAYYERVFPTNMPPAIQAIVRLLKNPPKGPAIEYKLEYPFLKHPCERQVVNILCATPGSYFVMRPNFDAQFDRDFAESLADPLVQEEGDSDEVKLMKKNIEDIKRVLADVAKRENKQPSEVMNEYADSLFDLGQFKNSLDGELNKIYANPELTDAEVKDFCEAANKMLESKGLDPIPYPDLTSRSVFFLYDEHELNNKGTTE